MFESLWSGYVISEKNFVLSVAHGDGIFAQIGPKGGNF